MWLTKCPYSEDLSTNNSLEFDYNCAKNITEKHVITFVCFGEKLRLFVYILYMYSALTKKNLCSK